MSDRGRPSKGAAQDESVADYAKREIAEARERESKKQRYWEGQKKVTAELPERFFELATSIRKHLDAFNKIVDGDRHIAMTESAGLATRSNPERAEINLRFSRKGLEAWVGLGELMRLGAGKPNAFLIEAHVKLSKARVRVRAEGIPRLDGGVRYRVMVDGKESQITLEDLGEKLVLALAKDEPQILGAATSPP